VVSSQLLELAESPYRLFELVRGAVEESVGRVERVKPYRVHLDLSTLELLIERLEGLYALRIEASAGNIWGLEAMLSPVNGYT